MSAFIAVLEHQEDKGVRAVLIALEKMRIFSFDRENECIKINPDITKISIESLNLEIDRQLGKRSP